jgi:hypothetical protein
MDAVFSGAMMQAVREIAHANEKCASLQATIARTASVA